MARSKRSKTLVAFFKSLQAEWRGLYRKFPDQTIFALADKRVAEAIEKRFARKESIKNIRQLDFDFYAGLINLCFEFSPSLDDGKIQSANAFLVILDGTCKVISLVDPFDPVQPNVFVPPLPDETEQPFVLHRPSASKNLSFSDAALYPMQVRSRAFFERLRSGGSGIIIDLNIYTWCTYQTWTPYGTVIDTILDDCGSETPILA